MGWRVLSEFESIFLLIAERLDEGIRLVLIQPAQITHTVRAHVRFGSKADIPRGDPNVCFTPESRHKTT
jgi:hypothetical protein